MCIGCGALEATKQFNTKQFNESNTSCHGFTRINADLLFSGTESSERTSEQRKLGLWSPHFCYRSLMPRILTVLLVLIALSLPASAKDKQKQAKAPSIQLTKD